MLEELQPIVDFILKEQRKSNEQWRNSEYYSKMNLSKIEVRDLPNSEYLDKILLYREFINENNVNLMKELKERFSIGTTKIQNRVKLRNSVEDKIIQYNGIKHDNGKVIINKCLNDLFGVRAIYCKKIDFEQIKKFVEESFPDRNVRYVNRNIKDDQDNTIYRAVHLYFKEDNYNFQWELQIWNNEDSEMNLSSHAVYKQQYTVWEKDTKGGGL